MGMGIRKRVRIGLIVAAFALIFAFVVDAEMLVNAVSDVDTVNNVNTVNTVSDVDTINNVYTADNVNESINDSSDTARHVDNYDKLTVSTTDADKDSSSVSKRPPPPMISNDPPQLSGAYWGFGLGLSVGTVPVFPMWQKNFPDSLSRLGLSPAFAADAEKGDTALLLVYYSASIEAAGSWAIPPLFFNIDDYQRTSLTIALGASPIGFVRESEINANSNFNDDARMSSVADSVRKAFATLSGNGLSLSWRIGLSAIKRYPSGYGAEFGLFYSGSYSNYFYSDGVRLTEDHIKTRGADLNAENVVGGKPLSFLSSQAELRVTVLVPTRKRDTDY